MRLLFVCTGNVCRSPLAAQLMATWARQALGPRAAAVHIASAGVDAATRQPMDVVSRWALMEVGGDPDVLGEHVVRPLSAAEVAGADLVLTMTRWQRRKVLELAPRALRRTFTLPEARDLLARIDHDGTCGVPLDQRARNLAARLDAARATRQVSDQDDVPDPVRCPQDVHQAVAIRIAADLRPLAVALFGDPSPAPGLLRGGAHA